MQVLVVDDHQILLEVLVSAARRAFDKAVVRRAKNLESALLLMKERAADLVMLDLGLPGYSGIEALLRLRKAHPRARVLVVSGIESPVTIRAALDAGAAGFLPKTSDTRLYVRVLRVVGAGGTYVPPQASDDNAPGSPVAQLTDRQRAVMDELLRGRTVDEAGRSLGIALGTAKHHAHAVYEAFGVASRADLMIAAARKGILRA